MIVASPVKIGLMAQLLSNENIHEDRPNFGDFMVHHKHQPLHDKINPKDCQVLSLGDSGFLQFFGLFQVMTWQAPNIGPGWG